jgi:hypothetical protein
LLKFVNGYRSLVESVPDVLAKAVTLLETFVGQFSAQPPSGLYKLGPRTALVSVALRDG